MTFNPTELFHHVGPAPPLAVPDADEGLNRSGDACRAAAYRRRRDSGKVAVVVPTAQPRRPVTVYECDGCGARAVGEQRCEECRTFMRRVGIGGLCPRCDEAVAVNELLGQEVIA